jgi:hypothetical protein
VLLYLVYPLLILYLSFTYYMFTRYLSSTYPLTLLILLTLLTLLTLSARRSAQHETRTNRALPSSTRHLPAQLPINCIRPARCAQSGRECGAQHCRRGGRAFCRRWAISILYLSIHKHCSYMGFDGFLMVVLQGL